MDISVVVPLYNEAESLPELAAWIERVMQEHGFTYEVIMVNDGRSSSSCTSRTLPSAGCVSAATMASRRH